jgi:hypothetical protein
VPANWNVAPSPAGGAVEPEAIRGRRRDVSQPPRRGREDLGDDVGHVIRADAVDRVGLDGAEVRLVEGTEPPLPLIEVLVVTHTS